MISAVSGTICTPRIIDDERLAAVEAELREREGGEECKHQRERDHDETTIRLFLTRVPEERLMRRIA